MIQPMKRTAPKLSDLLTRERWIEIGRIVLTGTIALLYWRAIVPLPVLLVAVAIGLYPLAKKGAIDLYKEHKVGTEVFVTIATTVAVFGGETVAGAVLMSIILIAEFIADLNTDRARASIKGLIGSVAQVALVRADGGERSVPIAELQIGDVVLARAGEKIPVDGVVVGGSASVNPPRPGRARVPQFGEAAARSDRVIGRIGSTMRPRWCIAVSLVASCAALGGAAFARVLPLLVLQTLSIFAVAVSFLAAFLTRRALLAPVSGERARIRLALVLSSAAALLACLLTRQS